MPFSKKKRQGEEKQGGREEKEEEEDKKEALVKDKDKGRRGIHDDSAATWLSATQ